MSIIIDEEFKSLIPPLSDDEFRQLEANCVRDGIRDPLVVWPQDDGNDILVDGEDFVDNMSNAQYIEYLCKEAEA